ncbi:GNAT family N-acetyltransferase [Nocardia mexicana]|uniref:Ribosomal-protein-alanine N-acetyltransferase n=1 Tax=Nocardia mexicana TaxID=279262 RepID=A0A370HF01_9NOCA|nr:GNAT family protein [Nocardia mexicana]RDI55818.1 ribosomal-protein-alanine N-acetyltransferase [Nocardia mexicana]
MRHRTAARLGPMGLHGSTVVIRPPRPGDHPQWRRLRLRDRALIEPFWYSSRLDWATRHTEKQWVREYLVSRAEMRAGRRLPGVIEIDGRFAGQCELCSIDLRRGTAEMSIWIDSRLARHGFGGLAAGLVVDHGFETLGLARIIAPISPGNTAAARGAAELGFVREALMTRYFDAGGARRDHELWALTRDDRPPEGFAASWIRRILAKDAEGTSASIPATSPRPTMERGSVESADDDSAGQQGVSSERLHCAAALFSTALRLAIGQVWRRATGLGGGCRVCLEIPGYPYAVLRSRRLSDRLGWAAARRRNPAHFGGSRPRAWWREIARSHGGLRSPAGLVLVLDVDGTYAGEGRLFDLDMFDRNARMRVWADPAHADEAVRAAATRALLDHAFGTLGLLRVATEIDSEDRESADVAARAGLLKEGIMRNYPGPAGRHTDHALWALTVALPDEEHS